MAAAAVIALVIEAIHTRLSGSIGRPLLASRVPAAAVTTSPSGSTAATETPGTLPAFVACDSKALIRSARAAIVSSFVPSRAGTCACTRAFSTNRCQATRATAAPVLSQRT